MFKTALYLTLIFYQLYLCTKLHDRNVHVYCRLVKGSTYLLLHFSESQSWSYFFVYIWACFRFIPFSHLHITFKNNGEEQNYMNREILSQIVLSEIPSLLLSFDIEIVSVYQSYCISFCPILWGEDVLCLTLCPNIPLLQSLQAEALASASVTRWRGRKPRITSRATVGAMVINSVMIDLCRWPRPALTMARPTLGYHTAATYISIGFATPCKAIAQFLV
jgi:hypothetical protein